MSYDAFGTLKILLQADFNGDGTVTQDDMLAFSNAVAAEDPAADFNGDGTVDEKDVDPFVVAFYGTTGLRVPDEVRIGYAGYVRDRITDKLLARHRWYEPGAGRWISRDPAGYVDGLDLYLYVRGNPLSMVDPMGLAGEEWNHALPKQVFLDDNDKPKFKGVNPNDKEFGRVMRWKDHRGGADTGDPSKKGIHDKYNEHWKDWVKEQKGGVTLRDVRNHLKQIEEGTGDEFKQFREWLGNGVKADRSYSEWRKPSFDAAKKEAWFTGKVEEGRAALRKAADGARLGEGMVDGGRFLKNAGKALKAAGWVGAGAALLYNASAVYAGEKSATEGVIDTVSPVEVQDCRNLQTVVNEVINNWQGNVRSRIGHMDSNRSLDERPFPIEQR